MAEKFKKIIVKTYNNFFVLTGLLIILFAGVIYLLLGDQAANLLVEQMLHREQIAARAGALSLKMFMNDFSVQTAAYSMSPDIVSFDSKKVPKDLKMFLDAWKETPVSGLILVDKDGIVRFGADRFGPTGEGLNVSEREYFKWAKTAKEGEVYFVDPYQSKIGFTSGSYVVSAVSPVIKDGKFNGAFVTGFLLNETAERFLDPLKISEDSRIYLFNQDGAVLSGQAKNLIGINYLDFLAKSGISGSENMIEKLKGALGSGKEDKLDIVLPNENKKGALTRYLIAYSPIVVGNQHWYVAVSTPATDALTYLTPFYFQNLILVGIMVFGFLIIIIRLSKMRGYKEGVEEEHKIHSDSTPPEITS